MGRALVIEDFFERLRQECCREALLNSLLWYCHTGSELLRQPACGSDRKAVLLLSSLYPFQNIPCVDKNSCSC